MIKHNQSGFTLLELLVALGILAVVAPLLATGMFQILTSTERGRAGFEAQADTRNVSSWLSQDIVMAQEAVDSPGPYYAGCVSDADTFATFIWKDWFGDPVQEPRDHTVSYCMGAAGAELTPGGPTLKGTELLRFYDCGDPVVIGRQVSSIKFTIGPPPEDSLSGRQVTIDVTADPERNRYEITDTKTISLKTRPMPPTPGLEPVPCSP